MSRATPLRVVESAPEVAKDPVRVAVIIPCYRAKGEVLGVLSKIGPECHDIYVVDDGCPEGTGELVKSECDDPRVRVLFHGANQGVGAAVMTGYRAALEANAAVLLKLDGDGQMDPADIPLLLAPILRGEADYTKGNRFWDLAHVREMPLIRLLGNSALSFITKLSSGYWDCFDPTNGFTAMHAAVARRLRFERIAKGYFFESDMLYHLGLLRAVVLDVPMRARYRGERSHLRVGASLVWFSVAHVQNTVRRIFFNYFLRDFSAASVELLLGLPLVLFGLIFGSYHWIVASRSGIGAYSGTVMLAALPIIVGVQMLIAWLSFDVNRVPRHPIHKNLAPPSG